MNILDKIIASKYIEVEARKKATPIDELMEMPMLEVDTKSFAKALSVSPNFGIIAEFKRKSPSKGVINEKVNIGDVARGYTKAGAAAISVLTDELYFGGQLIDVLSARLHTNCPILRKEFIVDEYQIYEARAYGADAILLIAAALTKSKIAEFAKLAKEIDLDVILELHDVQEIDSINEYVDIIGVNNRDLKTFEVDIEKSVGMAELIPAHFVKISESGISNPESIVHLRNHGYQGFLIGETFMREADPAAALMGFIIKLREITS